MDIQVRDEAGFASWKDVCLQLIIVTEKRRSVGRRKR